MLFTCKRVDSQVSGSDLSRLQRIAASVSGDVELPEAWKVIIVPPKEDGGRKKYVGRGKKES